MSVSKVKTKNGEVKWMVQVYTHGRGSKRIKRRFDTKTDAMAFLDEYKLRVHEQKKAGYGVRDFEETTFAKEAEYWMEHRSKTFSPGHLKRVKGVLEEVLPEIGRMSPIRIQPELLSDFQNRQLAKGLAPATVNRKTEVITAILALSVKHRRIPFNPSSGFQKLKPARQGVSFWEPHEAQSFLTFADRKYPKGSNTRWIYVSYLTALNTALRAGELWGLQPQDITRDGQVLFVQRQYDRVLHDFGPLKWNMPPRYVPCNEEVHAELVALIKKHNIPPGETIFQGPEGKPICHDDFGKRRFRADVLEAGVRLIRFHDLRHTATTLMIASGTDVNTVREICGHKSLKTTMDYTHVLAGAVKQVAKNFGISAKSHTPEPPKSPAPTRHSTESGQEIAVMGRPLLRLVR